MRRMLSLTLMVLAFASAAAMAADNSIGTWKADIEKSRYTPAPWPVKSLTVVREAVPGGVKVTNSGERTNGTAINTSYTAKYDGTEAAVTGDGSPYDSVSIKQVNANTFHYEAKKTNGKYHAIGRIVISNGGKTMTLTASGTDPDGKPMTLSVVYEKQ